MPGVDHDMNSRIPFRQALAILAKARRDSDVIVTNQGSSRVWPLIADHRLDFHFNPSTMGGAIPLALGLALAQPQRRVIVLSGDGSLLMSMGSLVTVVAAACSNLCVILMDNEIYDVTGRQKTAASELNIQFDEMARSIGFETVRSCSDAPSWESTVGPFLQSSGPTFCWLKVEPALPEDMMTVQEAMPSQLDRIRQPLIS
jgi:thiamine pyrophosphate-dependent acetolactate synthase large subunit-like protein